MSEDNYKKVVREDYNYKNRSPIQELVNNNEELILLRKVYRKLKDKIADSVGLDIELQQEDLEDIRLSTRVAYRFKNIEYALAKNENIKSTTDALKPLAYSHKPGHIFTDYQLQKFREEFGNEAAEYEIKYSKSELKSSQDLKEEK